jgi:outer membrane murein-binding lipoprotein Lpp
MKKIVSTTIAAAVLASGLVFVQCGDSAADESRQAVKAKFERVDRETPEMAAKRAQFYQHGIDRLNQAVQSGKLEQAQADFILKQMAHDKAFKDANPEWTKYFFNFAAKKGEKKDGKKFEGKAKIDRPKPTSAEMKANWEKFYNMRIEKINEMVSNGKMDKAQADFTLKWMESDKAFKDANPDWAEYGFFGRCFHGPHGKKAK